MKLKRFSSLCQTLSSFNAYLSCVSKYSCLRCRKRAIAAAKRREERARIKERKKERSKEKSKEMIKIKEKKKEKKKDAKAIVKSVKKVKSIKKVKKEPTKKVLSKEELREQALAIAMKEAKKRGLPDGWGVFYGVS